MFRRQPEYFEAVIVARDAAEMSPAPATTIELGLPRSNLVFTVTVKEKQ